MNENRTLKTFLGILIPNLASLLIVGVCKYVVSSMYADYMTESMKGHYRGPYTDYSSIFIFSDFIIVPLLMGIISAYFWRDLEFRNIRYVGMSAINSVFAIGLSAIFLGEGYICLVIVSPLVFGFVIAGTFIGKAMFRRRNNTLNSSVFGILLIIILADTLSKHEYSNEVSDTITINAPADSVWKYIVEYEPNTEKENFWLFQIGMPSPLQSTVDGHRVGAGRKCIFSNGYVFDEIMTVYEPAKDLTFDIVTQPRDPEIMGHIDILRGQFLLKQNGNGTTTLTGNSWYKLYVFPVWYFDIWARSITRNVHLRVMEHVKKICEKNV